jgi:hypothetical protein
VKLELAAPQLPATPSSRPDELHQELNQVKFLTFKTNREPTQRTSLFFHSTNNTSENKQQTPWRPTEAQDQARRRRTSSSSQEEKDKRKPGASPGGGGQASS